MRVLRRGLLGAPVGESAGELVGALLLERSEAQGVRAQPGADGLPPVLGLFALIGFGVLFGPLGVIVATPLTLVGLVVVKEISGSRRAPEGAPSSQQVHMES